MCWVIFDHLFIFKIETLKTRESGIWAEFIGCWTSLLGDQAESPICWGYPNFAICISFLWADCFSKEHYPVTG